jgi:hypothetical protein
MNTKHSSSEHRDQVATRARGHGDELGVERPPLIKWNSSGGEKNYRRRPAPGPSTPPAESQPIQSVQSAFVQDQHSQATLYAAQSTPVYIHPASAPMKQTKSPSLHSIDKLIHHTHLRYPFKPVPPTPCVVKRKPVPKVLPLTKFPYIESTLAWLPKPAERLFVIYEHILHGTSDKSPQKEEV